MPAWTHELATGDERIDRQHQEIFRRVEAFHAAMLRGDRGESGRLLEYLGTYVGEHFAAEERAMRESAYPKLARHRNAHGQFVHAYLSLVKAFDKQGPTGSLTLELKAFLVKWLSEHILQADVELARHLVRSRCVLAEVA